ncbi:MAG: ATP-binding cassette domain-containing protein [Bdellovibrionaceae bacterium]|nr:ATP-binding cassette domain-containing protein [Pseudobdellovibrionaceae bacterium]
MATKAYDSAVEVENLKKTFNGKDYVLNGLNLNVPKGKITVIIGFSGTGKSVLLKHILGLLEPSEGTIKVLGRDLAKLSHDERIQLRMKFGVLFQYAALFDDMSVLDNVLFPLKEHRRDLSMVRKKEIAYEKLKQAGLEEKHYAKLPSEISGGMRKRCGLARALALDPDILVYDEPTTGLDPVLTEMVDNLIVETHNHKKGSSTLVVSHDLHAAFRIGDYIVMLDSGKVLLDGPPEVFFQTEIPLVKKFVNMGVHKSHE